MLPELLDQIHADGAYDTQSCHAAIAARDACAVIPARKNARVWLENTPRRTSQERHRPRHLPPWPSNLEALGRVSPTKLGRSKDAMLQTAGRARHGARLRQASG